MLSYILKYRKKQKLKTRGLQKFAVGDSKKFRFIKYQEASTLLSNLELNAFE